ncbi:hypothetical protein LIA77_01198 [Sarocladium implicatum]|nr:hypothetical protein LIA77_01198 [Sarocladium implicatum]
MPPNFRLYQSVSQSAGDQIGSLSPHQRNKVLWSRRPEQRASRGTIEERCSPVAPRRVDTAYAASVLFPKTDTYRFDMLDCRGQGSAGQQAGRVVFIKQLPPTLFRRHKRTTYSPTMLTAAVSTSGKSPP